MRQKSGSLACHCPKRISASWSWYVTCSQVSLNSSRDCGPFMISPMAFGGLIRGRSHDSMHNQNDQPEGLSTVLHNCREQHLQAETQAVMAD